MKRIASLVLALTLCAGLAVPAWAEETTGPESTQAADFSDVPATSPFYEGIMNCAAKSIVSGYADGTFKPGSSVTRAQFAVMLSRAFFTAEADALKARSGGQPWYWANLKALADMGLLAGTGL